MVKHKVHQLYKLAYYWRIYNEVKILNKESSEIQEIIDTQKVIDEVIVAISDAIKRIGKEIQKIVDSKSENKKTNAASEATKGTFEATKDVSDNVKIFDVDEVRNKIAKKCRYFNRGYCKYSDKCKFIQPIDIS